MDNDTQHSLSPRTGTVAPGDRGTVGIAIWLTAALIVVVAASQFGPLKRFLAPAPPAPRPEIAAAADTPPPPPTAPESPASAEPLPPPAQQAAPPSEPAAAQMATLMLKEPPPSAQVAARSAQPSLPAGEAGLVEAMRKGLLRPASGGDLAVWKSRWSQANGRGVPQSFDERTRMTSAYVIQRDFDIPDGLSGAHAVIFVLEKGVPYPRGDPGHSVILDQATGACMGPVCGMLLQ